MSNTPQWPPSGDPNAPHQWGANGSGGMPPQQPNQGPPQNPNSPGWQQQPGLQPGQQPHGQQPYGQHPGQQQYGQQPGQPQYSQQPYGGDSTAPAGAPGFATSNAYSTPPPQTEKKGLGGMGIALIVGAIVLVLLVGMVGLGVVLMLNKKEPPAPTVAVPTPDTETTEPTPTDPTQETTTDPTEQPTQTQAGSPDEVNKPPALPDWIPDKKWEELPASAAKTEKDRILMENWIYGYNMPIPKGCPALKPKPNAATYKATAPKLLDCLSNAWAPLFEHAGKKYDKPEAVFFNKRGESPCLKKSSRLASVYCPQNNTVYIYEPEIKYISKDKDLPYVEVYRYFLYHVANQAGIYAEAGAKNRDIDDSVRRLRLQNSCMISRQMLLTDSGNFSKQQVSEYLARQLKFGKEWGIDPEKAGLWGLRGFYMERVGGCNTWTLPKAKVK